MEAQLQKGSEVLSALLKSRRVIKDDTQLEKFVGWMIGLAVDEDAVKTILTVPGVTEFFNHVGSKESTVTFQSLVVGLRLAPHFAVRSLVPCLSPESDKVDLASEPGSFPVWLEGLMTEGKQSQHWEQGSVRHAWISGILLLCESKAGLKWALTKDYLDKAVECLHDRSIFVSSIVQKLICYILPQLASISSHSTVNGSVPADMDEALQFEMSSDLQQRLRKVIIEPLTHRPWKFSKILVVLKLIEMSCKDEQEESKTFFLDHKMGVYVLNLLLDESILRQSSVTQQGILTLTALLKINPKGDIMDRTRELPLSMLRRSVVQPAMALASELMHSVDQDSVAVFEETIALPVLMVLGRPLLSLDADIPAVVRPLLERSCTGCSLILQSVHFLSTMDVSRRSKYLPLIRDLLDMTLGQREIQLARYIHNSERLQLSLVNFTLQFIKTDESLGQLPTTEYLLILQQMLQLLNIPGLAATLTLKTFHCILCCLTHLTTPPAVDRLTDGEHVALQTGLEQLAEHLKQSLCDVRWEVRDSALEIIAQMFQCFSDNGVMKEWLQRSRMSCHVWQSVEDGQSYVRATAITALGNISCQTQLWQQLLQDHPQEKIAKKVIEILEADTEAFPRRGAIRLLTRWLWADSVRDHIKTIQSAVNAAIHDLDWEVKLSVLQYWQQVLGDKLTHCTRDVPEYAADLSITNNSRVDALKHYLSTLDQVCDMGGLNCLLVGISDYDQSVRHKAATILVQVKSTYDQAKLVSNQSSEPPRKQHCPGLSENSIVDNGNDQGGSNPTTKQFLCFLEAENFDKLVAETSESIDDYVRNPMSLLDDILISLVKDDDENAVDCY